MAHTDYLLNEIPMPRLPTIDGGRLSANKQHMAGLIEVDVTNLRNNLKSARSSGKGVSFLAYIIKSIADCIAKNKEAHAMMFKKRKLVIFDDVDISLPVEKNIDNIVFPFPIIIRGANKKSVAEIDAEINEAVAKKNIDDMFFMKNKKQQEVFLRLFYSLPQFLRVMILKKLIGSPFRFKKFGGTTGITTVNIGSRVSGWVFPITNTYNIYFAIGSVKKKPVVQNNNIVIRDIMNLSVLFNHDVIDGSPARRFMNELISIIEKGEVNF